MSMSSRSTALPAPFRVFIHGVGASPGWARIFSGGPVCFTMGIGFLPTSSGPPVQPKGPNNHHGAGIGPRHLRAHFSGATPACRPRLEGRISSRAGKGTFTDPPIRSKTLWQIGLVAHNRAHCVLPVRTPQRPAHGHRGGSFRFSDGGLQIRGNQHEDEITICTGTKSRRLFRGASPALRGKLFPSVQGQRRPLIPKKRAFAFASTTLAPSERADWARTVPSGGWPSCSAKSAGNKKEKNISRFHTSKTKQKHILPCNRRAGICSTAREHCVYPSSAADERMGAVSVKRIPSGIPPR